MASIFNTEDLMAVSEMRKAPVERVNEIPRARNLPQNGQDLPQARKQPAPALEAVEKAVQIMNEHVQHINRQLQFRVDSDINRIVITVIDSDTDEIIRQIPGDQALNYARKLAENSELEIFDEFV